MSTAVKGVYAHLDCLVDSIDALQRAGAATIEMPATPQRVWQALQTAALHATSLFVASGFYS